MALWPVDILYFNFLSHPHMCLVHFAPSLILPLSPNCLSLLSRSYFLSLFLTPPPSLTVSLPSVCLCLSLSVRQLIKSQRVQNKLGIVFEKEKDKSQRKDFIFASAKVGAHRDTHMNYARISKYINTRAHNYYRQAVGCTHKNSHYSRTCVHASKYRHTPIIHTHIHSDHADVKANITMEYTSIFKLMRKCSHLFLSIVYS